MYKCLLFKMHVSFFAFQKRKIYLWFLMLLTYHCAMSDEVRNIFQSSSNIRKKKLGWTWLDSHCLNLYDSPHHHRSRLVGEFQGGNRETENNNQEKIKNLRNYKLFLFKSECWRIFIYHSFL